jgi:hypothetical protein
MLILGTLFAFATFSMYIGRFKCDKTQFEMALPPAIMTFMVYAAAYACLLLSGMEWVI